MHVSICPPLGQITLCLRFPIGTMTAVFLFGNLVMQDPMHVVPSEPNTPCVGWLVGLAALGVFETGENLPIRTNSRSFTAIQDWRMVNIGSCTLVYLVRRRRGTAMTSIPPGPDSARAHPRRKESRCHRPFPHDSGN